MSMYLEGESLVIVNDKSPEKRIPLKKVIAMRNDSKSTMKGHLKCDRMRADNDGLRRDLEIHMILIKQISQLPPCSGDNHLLSKVFVQTN